MITIHLFVSFGIISEMLTFTCDNMKFTQDLHTKKRKKIWFHLKLKQNLSQAKSNKVVCFYVTLGNSVNKVP